MKIEQEYEFRPIHIKLDKPRESTALQRTIYFAINHGAELTPEEVAIVQNLADTLCAMEDD